MLLLQLQPDDYCRSHPKGIHRWYAGACKHCERDFMAVRRSWNFCTLRKIKSGVTKIKKHLSTGPINVACRNLIRNNLIRLFIFEFLHIEKQSFTMEAAFHVTNIIFEKEMNCPECRITRAGFENMIRRNCSGVWNLDGDEQGGWIVANPDCQHRLDGLQEEKTELQIKLMLNHLVIHGKILRSGNYYRHNPNCKD